MRLALIVACLFLAARVVSAADWSLEIIPTDVTKAGPAIMLDDLTPEFHVILRNTSNRTLEIWKEWCSAGWWNLRFQVERRDGTTFEIRKAGHNWTWNYPDPYYVLPNHSYVWSVKFDKDWAMPSGFKVPTQVKLTAIFEEQQDPDLKRRMVSPEKEARLLRRQDALRQTLQKNPYDKAAMRELGHITAALADTQRGENLWIGKVQSDPISLTLCKH